MRNQFLYEESSGSRLSKLLVLHRRFLPAEIQIISLHALEALKEFLTERNQLCTVDEDNENGAAGKIGRDSEVKLVKENWNLSQFWYDLETAETVAAEVAELCKSDDFRVACIACPTLYAYLKRMPLLLDQHLSQNMPAIKLYWSKVLHQLQDFVRQEM
ncbi:hypothetical protein QQ045_032012 [Rhodiola kirilowii]